MTRKTPTKIYALEIGFEETRFHRFTQKCMSTEYQINSDGNNLNQFILSEFSNAK